MTELTNVVSAANTPLTKTCAICGAPSGESCTTRDRDEIARRGRPWRDYETALTHEDRSVAAVFIDIVFDGPPAHESCRFVEVEDANGHSISIGQWIERGDGMWALRLTPGSTK